MSDQETIKYFTKKNAQTYDQQREKLSPIKHSLHLCMRAIYTALPDEAHILCAGVGTGAELLYLAKEFPQWQFTAFDPAEDMLDQCKKRADEAGIASRCQFHTGYIDSIPKDDRFDAATSILVSHFIADLEMRKQYFSEIAERLKANGKFINAELAYDRNSPSYNEMCDTWQALHDYADMPSKDPRHKMRMPSTMDMEKLLISSGLTTPALFFQNLLIHAWFSRKPAE